MATGVSLGSTGPLVGRQREVTAVRALLEEERLVTVTGAGGSGKTRLAAEVLAGAAGDALFVPLAAVREAALVPAAVAEALGLAASDAEDAVVDALAGRELLLVLDNFEHVVDAAPFVARLLAGAAGVRLLVTSQTPLRLTAEQEFPLAPLAIDEAVEFFVQRARRHDPGFAADAAVEEICRRLEGLPLALELAAARSKLLRPEQMLERLERRLPLLTGGARDLPERHRTLQAAIDWSYGLLTEDERRALAQLAVFPGGCTLDAAEAVVGADAFELVASLVDKSLLRRQDGEEPRFRMLETIREYARGRLEDADGLDDALRRRTAYYVARADASADELNGPRGPGWRAWLRAELDTIESVVGSADAESLAALVARWWTPLFHLAPARVVALEARVASRLDAVSLERRGEALRAVGYVRLQMRDAAGAVPLLRASVDAAIAAGGEAAASRGLSLLATALVYAHRPDEARAAAKDALVRARGAGDEALARVLANVGGCLNQLGDSEEARAVLEEGVALATRLQLDPLLFVARVNLGFALLSLDPDEAGRVFGSALALGQGIGDSQVLHASEGLALAALLQGRTADARAALLDLVDEARRVGRVAQVFSGLVGLAAVEAVGGRADAAGRLLAAARSVNADLAIPRSLAPLLEGVEPAADPQLGLDQLLADARDDAAVVTRTFLFTDVVSSTQLVELLGDAAWATLSAWHDRTLRALFAEHRGVEVDHAGDGFLVAFAHEPDALACAVAVQRALATHRHEHGFAPQVRVGLHTAAATLSGDAYRGLGIHTAARVAAAAGADEILTTGVAEGESRTLALKGLAEPVAVTAVDWA